MHLYSIETGNFKLDGGAMFGVVPKVLWEKTNPADSSNKIEMSARCLLIEDGKRLILVDAGLGNKQSEKFFWGLKLLQKGAIFGSRGVLARGLWVRLLGVERRKSRKCLAGWERDGSDHCGTFD